MFAFLVCVADLLHSLGSGCANSGCSKEDKFKELAYAAFDKWLARDDCVAIPGKTSECPLCNQGAAILFQRIYCALRMIIVVVVCLFVTFADNKCTICTFYERWVIPAARESFR